MMHARRKRLIKNFTNKCIFIQDICHQTKHNISSKVNEKNIKYHSICLKDKKDHIRRIKCSKNLNKQKSDDSCWLLKKPRKHRARRDLNCEIKCLQDFLHRRHTNQTQTNTEIAN